MVAKLAPHSELWLLSQLQRVSEHRPELVAAAIQRALADDEVLRWAVVVGAFRDRRINLGKAAEPLEPHELELRARFLELGIPLRIGAEDIAEAEAEVAAARGYLNRVG